MKKNYYAEYVNEVAKDDAIELALRFGHTYEEVCHMSGEERDALEDACREILDGYVMDSRWDIAYKQYCILDQVRRDEYRAANENKVRAFFKAHFEGKSWETIRNDAQLYESWSFYSDWHKDCFGYRPHAVACGI